MRKPFRLKKDQALQQPQYQLRSVPGALSRARLVKSCLGQLINQIQTKAVVRSRRHVSGGCRNWYPRKRKSSFHLRRSMRWSF